MGLEVEWLGRACRLDALAAVRAEDGGVVLQAGVAVEVQHLVGVGAVGLNRVGQGLVRLCQFGREAGVVNSKTS